MKLLRIAAKSTGISSSADDSESGEATKQTGVDSSIESKRVFQDDILEEETIESFTGRSLLPLSSFSLLSLFEAVSFTFLPALCVVRGRFVREPFDATRWSFGVDLFDIDLFEVDPFKDPFEVDLFEVDLFEVDIFEVDPFKDSFEVDLFVDIDLLSSFAFVVIVLLSSVAFVVFNAFLADAFDVTESSITFDSSGSP